MSSPQRGARPDQSTTNNPSGGAPAVPKPSEPPLYLNSLLPLPSCLPLHKPHHSTRSFLVPLKLPNPHTPPLTLSPPPSLSFIPSHLFFPNCILSLSL